MDNFFSGAELFQIACQFLDTAIHFLEQIRQSPCYAGLDDRHAVVNIRRIPRFNRRRRTMITLAARRKRNKSSKHAQDDAQSTAASWQKWSGQFSGSLSHSWRPPEPCPQPSTTCLL